MKNRVIAVILLLTIVFFSGCSVISVDKASARGILPFLCPSDGTTISEDGTITMTTDVEDNRFSSVVLQLWTDSPKTHIMNIASSNAGKEDGIYTHEEETGSYVITLKGNSNKQDEGVEVKVYLVKGKSYVYSYDVKAFGEKEITIESFVFGIK